MRHIRRGRFVEVENVDYEPEMDTGYGIAETGREAPVDDPLRETTGRWRGLIDADALKHVIYADRLIATRPPVTL